MAREPEDGGHDHTWRFGQAYSQRELMAQEYRKLGFWSSVLSVVIVILLLATVVTFGAAAPFLFIALAVRFAFGLRRLYYRSVYRL